MPYVDAIAALFPSSSPHICLTVPLPRADQNTFASYHQSPFGAFYILLLTACTRTYRIFSSYFHPLPRVRLNASFIKYQ